MEYKFSEFIKKEEPFKFRAIINVNESYNVGVILNRAELKSVFHNIKNLLEDPTELSEPVESKRKVVIQEVEVTLEMALDFIKLNYPHLLAENDGEILVIIDEYETTPQKQEFSESAVVKNTHDNIQEVKSTLEKKGKKIKLLGLGLFIGIMTVAITNFDYIKKIINMLGM